MLLHYQGWVVNAVEVNNCCLFWDSYEADFKAGASSILHYAYMVNTTKNAFSRTTRASRTVLPHNSVSHGTIVQLSLSLRFGCYGKVPCYKTSERANKQIAL